MDILAIERLISTRLLADSLLTAIVSTRVYSRQAPPRVTLPYVTFRLQSAVNTIGVGGTVIIVRATYLVVVSGAGSKLTDLEPAGNRLVAVLPGNHGAIGCVFAQPVAYEEFDDGKDYRHLGGMFDFYASPAG